MARFGGPFPFNARCGTSFRRIRGKTRASSDGHASEGQRERSRRGGQGRCETCMSPHPLRTALLAALAALALLPAAASAAATVQLASDAFSVQESAGAATITVTRSDPRGRGEVRY